MSGEKLKDCYSSAGQVYKATPCGKCIDEGRGGGGVDKVVGIEGDGEHGVLGVGWM